MAQFEIYPNPGQKKADIPFLVVVQNNHITSRTGAAVVIPLRANTNPVETMAPLVDVPGKGQFVLSTDEIFAIDITRLKQSVGALSPGDRAKIKPAVDKVIGGDCAGILPLTPGPSPLCPSGCALGRGECRNGMSERKSKWSG